MATTPAASGRNASPDRSAEYPSTCCRYRVRKKNTGITALNCSSAATLADAMPGSRKVRSGSSAVPDRASLAMKTASSAAAPANSAIVRALLHPASGARVRP